MHAPCNYSELQVRRSIQCAHRSGSRLGCDSSQTPSWDLFWDFWGRRWQFHSKPGAAIADFFHLSFTYTPKFCLGYIDYRCQALCKGERVVRRAWGELWAISALMGGIDPTSAVSMHCVCQGKGR